MDIGMEVGNFVKITLYNNYVYRGEVMGVTDKFLSIHEEIWNKQMSFNKNDVAVLEVIKKAGDV